MDENLRYLQALRAAKAAENSGDLVKAAVALRRAEGLTNDDDELQHLRIWLKRLRDRLSTVRRTFYIYSINCDCGSDLIARTSAGRWMYGPRCRGCKRLLGPMEYAFVAKVRANCSLSALEWYRRNRLNTARATAEATALDDLTRRTK